MRHGGKILIDQLVRHRVRDVFLVPGESYLAALDGLYEQNVIRPVVCRHEGGAAMMAEASAKLSGEPGVCFVTRGPGVVNAVSGLYVAFHDETPLVLFVGLPPTGLAELRAFQHIDLAALFGEIAKWTAIVPATDQIPAYVARAFQVAASGRPGPVVLGLPQDMLAASSDVVDAEPATIAEPAPAPAQLAELQHRLWTAERPLLVVGGPGWSEDVRRHVEAFALRLDLPVASSFRATDYFDNRHPCYVGHLGFATEAKLAAAVRGADLVVVAGAPLGEVTTASHTLIRSPDPTQALVHVHASSDEIGRMHRAALGIVSSARAFAAALDTIATPPRLPWRALRRDLRAAYESWIGDAATPGAVNLEEVSRHVSARLPETAIVTNGAGNYSMFLHRFFVCKSYPSTLAPCSGSMGYSIPAAIAARLRHPEREIVAFAGDGCVMMTIQELATAVQYGLAFVLIVANNGMYGTIRMHQESSYPERVVGTSLVNPDFVRLAESFGGRGERVRSNEEFHAAFERARRSRSLYLIELVLDPEAIAPGRTLSGLRAKTTPSKAAGNGSDGD